MLFLECSCEGGGQYGGGGMVREGNTLQLVEQVRLTTTVPHSGGEHLTGTGGRKEKGGGGNENNHNARSTTKRPGW